MGGLKPHYGSNTKNKTFGNRREIIATVSFLYATYGSTEKIREGRYTVPMQPHKEEKTYAFYKLSGKRTAHRCSDR